MTKRMLIDATYAEETRVAVVSGHKLEEFDFEIASKKQLKGSIYLAKITRVEPSLQAAFVEFGGNRHGFLAFPEIHPDYYRIPVGDRRHAPEEEDEYQPSPGRGDYRRAERPQEAGPDGSQDAEAESLDGEAERQEGEDRDGGSSLAAAIERPQVVEPAPPMAAAENDPTADDLPGGDADRNQLVTNTQAADEDDGAANAEPAVEQRDTVVEALSGIEQSAGSRETAAEWAGTADGTGEADEFAATATSNGDQNGEAAETDIAHGDGEIEALAAEPSADAGQSNGSAEPAEERIVEEVGGDEAEEARQRRRFSSRHYKIQEVIKRRQIMLVQVTKEERGNKGAAVTTFLSLPGRYCVLMPNTPRGGGISRKISNPADRKRLKELLTELEVPDGMSVILRTAGIERSKAEIKRDLDYLLRLWDNIRELTLQSTAPALVYEEGNLVKRAIRDLYAREIDEVLVAGEEGYRTAKDFMRMLMPSHAKRVQPYRDPSVPLFFRFQVESQIDAIHNPVVQLKSGGYIVINQTEALVAIDVNSGRSTRERNIEETALKTNIEAADEVARQLRLRDLGGLIVVDFIDMEDGRHDAQVERRLKEAMKIDRARIQVGRISPFGLLELSRQRLRPSLMETNFGVCQHCKGTGVIRSVESAALLVLRAVEEEGIRQRAAEIEVVLPGDVALYVLNQKRAALGEIERRYGFIVLVSADNSLIPPEFRLERLRARAPDEFPRAISQERLFAETAATGPDLADEDEDEDLDDEIADEPARAANGHDAESANGHAGSSEEEQRRRRRRRRRRRGPEQRDDASDRAEARPEESFAEDDAIGTAPDAGGVQDEAYAGGSGNGAAGTEASGDEDEADKARRRRRGKRGGKRRLGRPDEAEAGAGDADPLLATGTEDGDSSIAHSARPETELAAASEDGSASADATEQEADGGRERARRPRRRRRPEADAPEGSPDLVATEERAAEAVPGAPVEPAVPAVDIRVAPPLEHQAASAPEAASNAADGSNAEQERKKDYENVNQPPAQPRKGWWQRLLS